VSGTRALALVRGVVAETGCCGTVIVHTEFGPLNATALSSLREPIVGDGCWLLGQGELWCLLEYRDSTDRETP